MFRIESVFVMECFFVYVDLFSEELLLVLI